MSREDSTSSEKRERTLTILTPITPSRTGKFISQRELEKQAEWLEERWKGVRYKLRELYPVLHAIHDHFTDPNRPQSQKFRGCRTWDEYCRLKLHCTRQAVFMMEKRLARTVEDHKPKKRKELPKFKRPASMLDSPERQEAAVMALDAINRFRMARSKGDDSAAAEAMREYEQIADGGLKSVIDGDRPNFQKLLIDVLQAAKKLEEAALQMHAALSDIVTSGMIPEHTTLLATVRVSLTGAEELLVAGKELAAVRRRLNIDQPVQ